MVCLYFAVDTDFLQSNQEGYTYIGVLGYFSWSIHVFGLYRLHTILEIWKQKDEEKFWSHDVYAQHINELCIWKKQVMH